MLDPFGQNCWVGFRLCNFLKASQVIAVSSQIKILICTTPNQPYAELQAGATGLGEVHGI